MPFTDFFNLETIDVKLNEMLTNYKINTFT